MIALDETALTLDLWRALGGVDAAMPDVRVTGTRGGLPSPFAVDVFAAACVAAATAAVSELWASRGGEAARAVTVDRRHAAVAFRSERYLRAVGAALPSPWDPIAGDYATRDGFVRLHTNYAHHRAAALRALGVTGERDEVRANVAKRAAEDVEDDVVAAGGCAAKLRSAAEWAMHPQGAAVSREPLVAVDAWPAAARVQPAREAVGRPLAGVRVLDLTRVIAGPVCTRVLAAYGADVLRVDPPGFEEIALALGDTTGGKRRTALDLRERADRVVFERLLREADALVVGYRSDALARLGLGPDTLRATNPGLVVVRVDAYGWTGPWANRRGFDSLVQMSAGVAARGREVAGGDAPIPLPAQALDHGTGYLLAAATCRALTRLERAGEASESRLSLARTAFALTALGDDGDPRAPELGAEDAAPFLEEVESPLGRLRRVRCPGTLEGAAPAWTHAPGPLGVDAPVWSPA